MGLASVLLVLSPFTQINTPYPSTAYLKGYLEAKGVRAGQADLGIETILTLFSTQGLGELFAEIERRKGKYPAKVRGMLANKQRYIDTITAVVAFLQGKNDPLAYRICNQDYLPESDRGSQNEEELRREFAKSATPAADVEDSLAGWGDNDSLQVFPEDYQAPSGIKYDSHITDHGMIVLNVESALRNVRPMKLTDLGQQVQYRIMEANDDWTSLIAAGDDFLIPDEEGVWLLDKDLRKKRLLIRSDLQVIHTPGGGVGIGGGHLMQNFYYDSERKQLRFTCYNTDKRRSYLVVASLTGLMASSQPAELKTFRNRLPIGNSYLFSMPGGYGMAVRHSDELYTFGMKGDTLCHFVLGNSERYKPRLFEAERDIVYHVGGRTLFYHAYVNKIYRVKDASTLEVVYKLDFGSLSRITGADVARGGNVRSSYFVTSCMETDHFLFLNVDKGYDSENARRKGEVQLYSLVYDKRNGEFFSLPEVTGGGHPESPLIAAGLQEDLPFWPNLNLNGDPAFVVGKAVLEKYYPIQLRGNDKLGEFNETDLILMTVK